MARVRSVSARPTIESDKLKRQETEDALRLSIRTQLPYTPFPSPRTYTVYLTVDHVSFYAVDHGNIPIYYKPYLRLASRILVARDCPEYELSDVVHRGHVMLEERKQSYWDERTCILTLSVEPQKWDPTAYVPCPLPGQTKKRQWTPGEHETPTKSKTKRAKTTHIIAERRNGVITKISRVIAE